MLQVNNLHKKFKTITAVNGINLYLEEGESVGLLGPNGAGKSTAISMISTLLTPTSGDVLFKGQDVLKQPDVLRPVLGVVPQEIALYEELTAYENMLFFGKTYGLSGKKLKRKIDEVLELVGLTERKKERIKNYSGGMKRRINIAVSLMHEPEVLIMDEPTVGIDPQSRSYILEMVRELNRNKGMSILYTSHYMEEVEKLCDRVYIMDHGQIIASGTKEELKSILSSEDTILIEVQQKSDQLINHLNEHALIQQVAEVDQGYKVIVGKGADVFADIFEIANKCQVKVRGVHIQTPTLEDVFLHLTGRKLRD
ncbi:daunorubicin resistance protein DrrA family ABC transporter ATP-binding protein [Amphibacillus xylanus]|uniref:Putative ABC transporter ATP-binding protein n=1 Tax=Amphibacillus xylanus (strain ATCC 51415 / DSM 6626 / JCM 7361 / LMG 17667 / NBRC 15112 / Ep01) TaxID=698758 RepID=K0IZM9_AMPXN|nr:daunorubicin resistance protein DrrA family ABC transporter ATP-binding protein [Amphibacillus xylanus]BAM46422.1 putative ABC transporter ATP-binding protein [Amphibacillus xylanus NBRC 15112]